LNQPTTIASTEKESENNKPLTKEVVVDDEKRMLLQETSPVKGKQ